MEQKKAPSRRREVQAVDYDYSLENQELTEAKLKVVAKQHIKGHPVAQIVDAFEVAYLTPLSLRTYASTHSI